MELYVPRLLPSAPPHVIFLILTACCASLIRCSLCFDAQYEYCINITYPLGVGNRGCGHPGFQISCKQNSTIVIEIHGRSYTILSMYSPNYFIIVRGDNCNFFNRPFNNLQIPFPEYGGAPFHISGKENRTLNVYKCNIPFQDAFDSTEGQFPLHDSFDFTEWQLRKCNATIFYDFYNLGNSIIRGCSMKQVVVEVGKARYVSTGRKRDEDCKSCEASGGICGYKISDTTSPFLCYCKEGPSTHKCPSHGMLYFNFKQYY